VRYPKVEAGQVAGATQSAPPSAAFALEEDVKVSLSAPEAIAIGNSTGEALVSRLQIGRAGPAPSCD
jgi:hypothetical protein